MCVDAVHTSEDVGELLHGCIWGAIISSQTQPRREMFVAREKITGPIEGVVAVIYRAAGLGRVMNCTEILPLGGSHLGTRLTGTWRAVGEECNDETRSLVTQKTAQFVEPQVALHRLASILSHRRYSQLESYLFTDRPDSLGRLIMGALMI